MATFQEQVKQLAYISWITRGRPQRDDWRDWFVAESLLKRRAYYSWKARGCPNHDDWRDWYWSEQSIMWSGPHGLRPQDDLVRWIFAELQWVHRVEEDAYFRWQRRGQPKYDDWRDWFEAEQSH